jgi:hypothetical protein
MHYTIRIDESALGVFNSESGRLETYQWLNPTQKFQVVANLDEALETLFRAHEGFASESLLPAKIEYGIKFDLWLGQVSVHPRI